MQTLPDSAFSNPRYSLHLRQILRILRSEGYPNAKPLRACGAAGVGPLGGRPGFVLDLGVPWWSEEMEKDLRRLLGPVAVYDYTPESGTQSVSILYSELNDVDVRGDQEKVPYFLRSTYPRGTILWYRVVEGRVRRHYVVSRSDHEIVVSPPSPFVPLHVSRRGDVWAWWDTEGKAWRLAVLQHDGRTRPYLPSAGSVYVGNILEVLGLPLATYFEVLGDTLAVDAGRSINIRKAALTDDGLPREALVKPATIYGPITNPAAEVPREGGGCFMCRLARGVPNVNWIGTSAPAPTANPPAPGGFKIIDDPAPPANRRLVDVLRGLYAEPPKLDPDVAVGDAFVVQKKNGRRAVLIVASARNKDGLFAVATLRNGFVYFFRTRTVQAAWTPVDLAEAVVGQLPPSRLLRAVLAHTKEISK